MTSKPASAPSKPALDATAVAALIREIPDREGLGPGDRIGAERELAERFSVGRWIVRRALEQLESEGKVLRTTNGRSGGVFVAPAKVMRDLDEFVGLPAYVRAQGMVAGATVLGTQTVPADDDLADKMGVAPGAWLYRIDRLRLADDLPLSLETAWLTAEAFPGLLNESLVGSVYDLLENKYGMLRGEAVETITATTAARQQASALQVHVGSPLLVVDRVARTADGTVFEYSHDLYRAERVAILVHTTGKDGAKRTVLPA